MALIKATPDSYQLKSNFRIPSNLGKGWSAPVISGSRLYLRDQDALLCYDLADAVTKPAESAATVEKKPASE